MASERPRILVADDQADVLESMRLLLKGEGYLTELVDSPAAVLDAIAQQTFDTILIDLNYSRDTTSGREGLELLDRLRQVDPDLPVVVMTAWGSIELAVEAMRRGAGDFFEKPWENDRVLAIVRNQVELYHARRKGQRLEAVNRAIQGEARPDFIAGSRAMRPVSDLIERVGPSDANVLITGENGTGKGVVARLLHAASGRSSQQLVTVNIGGLTESIFESELFGHTRGAFTDAKSDRIGRFEMADGGTLFLDEIGNLSLVQQAKLLQVVETGEFERVGASKTLRTDVRVLSATNADLEDAVAAGEFRKDLLYRLRTVEITIPPLRQRIEDLEPLANLFLARHAKKYDKELSGFSSEAIDALRSHSWPGNVRELDHAVERGVLMSRRARIEPSDLGLVETLQSDELSEHLKLDEAERLLIERALERNQGNVTLAANDLGLSRSALYRRLDKHGIG